MATPQQLREQATTLRDAARAMREKAAQLDTDLDKLRTHYPHTPDGVWVGQAADAFYDQVQQVHTNLGKVRTDVGGYADRCVTKARQLEDQADNLEAQAKKDQSGNESPTR